MTFLRFEVDAVEVMHAASKPHRPFWLTSQVARRLGLSAQSVREFESKGWLRCTKTETGTRLFDPEDVERFLADRHARMAAQNRAAE